MLLSLALAGAPPVVDETPPVGERLEFQWSAPPGCPEESDVRKAIDRYLGRDDFDRAVDDVRVSGAVRRMGEVWRLTTAVELPTTVVERTVEASGCADLANAAGLMIAVALDPLRVIRKVVPVEEVADTPSSADEGTADQGKPDTEARHGDEDDGSGHVSAAGSSPPPDQTPAPAARRRWSLELRTGGAGEIGTTTKLRGGTWLAIALFVDRVRVEVSGQYWFPREFRPFVDAPGAGASLQLGAAALRACYAPNVKRVEFPSCLSVEAGQMRARGIGLQETRVSRRPWVALAVGQEIAWTSGRHIGLWLGLDAVVNLVRPRVHVRDLGPVVATRIVGFRFVGGPAARF